MTEIRIIYPIRPHVPYGHRVQNGYNKKYKKGEFQMKILYKSGKTPYLRKVVCAEIINEGLMIRTYPDNHSHYFINIPFVTALSLLDALGKTDYLNLIDYEHMNKFEYYEYLAKTQ